MNRLPSIVRKNGFEYRLKRKGQSYIYEQWDGNRLVAYEVFKAKIRMPGWLFGHFLPEREVFPGNEDFGNTAWTVALLGDEEKALARAEEIFRVLEVEKFPCAGCEIPAECMDLGYCPKKMK
jgi:hypothetical protein